MLRIMRDPSQPVGRRWPELQIRTSSSHAKGLRRRARVVEEESAKHRRKASMHDEERECRGGDLRSTCATTRWLIHALRAWPHLTGRICQRRQYLPEAAKGGSSSDVLVVGNLLHQGHDPAPHTGTFDPHERLNQPKSL